MEGTDPIPHGFIKMPYWEEGLETAKSWYHEEWEGSDIQWRLARDIARAIDHAVGLATGRITP